MSHTLIVLPDDTAKPILDPINAAGHALNIRMFLFTEPTLLDAVIAAKRRGVKVRVMLNPARRSGETENEKARKALTAAGIDVRDSNPAFDLTHQKSMVIDDKIGLVESLNWEPKDLTQTRDYAVVTTDALEVARDGPLLRRRLGTWQIHASRRIASHLVPEQRPTAGRRVHR